MSDGVREILIVLTVIFGLFFIVAGEVILSNRGATGRRKYVFMAIASGIWYAIFSVLFFGFTVFIVFLGFIVGAGVGPLIMYLGNLRRRFNRWIIGEPDPQLKWLYTPRSSVTLQTNQQNNESSPMQSKENLKQEEHPATHQSPFPTPPISYSMEPLPSVRNFDQADADREALDR